MVSQTEGEKETSTGAPHPSAQHVQRNDSYSMWFAKQRLRGHCFFGLRRLARRASPAPALGTCSEANEQPGMAAMKDVSCVYVLCSTHDKGLFRGVFVM